MKPLRARGQSNRKRVAGALLVLSGLLLAGCLRQPAHLRERFGTETFPSDLFPPPVPAEHEGFSLSSACPNPSGLERPAAVDVAELLQVVSDHVVAVAKGDIQQARRTTDQAYWPILDQMKFAHDSKAVETQPIDENRVVIFGPASEELPSIGV